jgi:exonuclease VII small subunit
LPLVEDALSSIERAVTQLEEGHADTCMLEEALSSLTRAAAQLELV